MNKISILIAAYNVEKYISNCLDSCLAQTYKNYEIIIVNDGSTDTTRSIIADYIEKHDTIKCIDKINGGLVSARKAGVEVATGKYLFFLDGDDTIPSDALSLLIQQANSENFDIVIGQFLRSSDRRITTYKDLCGDGISYIKYILSTSHVSIVGNLYKRTLFADFMFPINLYKSLGEDLVTNITLGTKDIHTSSINHVTYNYLINDSSLIHSANKLSNSWFLGFGALIEVTKKLKDANIMHLVESEYFALSKTYIFNSLLYMHRENKYFYEFKAIVNSLLKSNLSINERTLLYLFMLNSNLAQKLYKRYLRK